MKHPVDTSKWGEFLLKDIATLTNGNKFDKNKMSHDNSSINFVSRTGFNNGISDFVDKIDGIEPYPAGAITLALGGSVGSTFVQPKPFYTGQNVGVIEFDNKSDKMKQFVAVVLNKVCSTQFSAFKNEINKHFKRNLSIPLPLKPSADPSNYDSTDIDWTYMETVMSRVTARAKDRLVNLPQPSNKQKTPVDTSGWGEFVVGELFDVKLSDGDNKPKELPKGNIPLISTGSANNGVAGTFESDTIIFPAHSFTVNMFGQAFYQPTRFQTVSHGHVNILIPNFKNNRNIGLFIVTVLNAQCQTYSFAEMLTSKKIKAESIPLPLKPSADPENYSQDDIDWDYMDRFMQTIEEKAQERVASLKEQI